MAKKKEVVAVEGEEGLPVVKNKKDMTMDEKLEALRLACEKKYGVNSLVRLGDNGSKNNVEFLSSDIMGLDEVLGGGYGKGRIVEVYGPESSGKTTITLHAIAAGQREGPCAFIDAEHAFDPAYARNLGVDTNSLWVSQPDSGEQALDILNEMINSDILSVIVVDSVAALTPQAEIDGGMGESHMGLHARLMSQALRKITGRLGKSKTVLIFTNQLRMKIGLVFGNPEVTCVHPETMVEVMFA